mgnify:CR=1 FL=1
MNNKQKGVAALLTIIIVGASALIMAFSASILGLGELDMGYISQQGAETLAIADGCMEESLERLRNDASYAGGSLSLGDGSCIITVSTSGNNSTTTVTANIDSKYFKKIRTTADINNGIVSIDSWEELTG